MNCAAPLCRRSHGDWLQESAKSFKVGRISSWHFLAFDSAARMAATRSGMLSILRGTPHSRFARRNALLPRLEVAGWIRGRSSPIRNLSRRGLWTIGCAVKLVDGLAGESPASADCPVGTVVISGDE